MIQCTVSGTRAACPRATPYLQLRGMRERYVLHAHQRLGPHVALAVLVNHHQRLEAGEERRYWEDGVSCIQSHKEGFSACGAEP